MKKLNIHLVLLYLLFLFIYSFPTLLEPFQLSYYDSLNKPDAMLPIVLFKTMQLVVIAILALSITLTINSVKSINKKTYPIILIIINYVMIQFYPVLLFKYHELLLALINVIFITLSTLLLYYFGNKVNKKANYLLIPVLLWSIYICFIQIGLLKLN
jgi:translocator protein